MEVSPKQRIQFMIRNQVHKLREQLDDLNQEIATCVKVQAHSSPGNIINPYVLLTTEVMTA